MQLVKAQNGAQILLLHRVEGSEVFLFLPPISYINLQLCILKIA